VLARRFLTGVLAVTLPGTLVLGAVALYAVALLGTVSQHLAEITLSLEATRGLHLAVSRADAPGPR